MSWRLVGQIFLYAIPVWCIGLLVSMFLDKWAEFGTGGFPLFSHWYIWLTGVILAPIDWLWYAYQWLDKPSRSPAPKPAPEPSVSFSEWFWSFFPDSVWLWLAVLVGGIVLAVFLYAFIMRGIANGFGGHTQTFLYDKPSSYGAQDHNTNARLRDFLPIPRFGMADQSWQTVVMVLMIAGVVIGVLSVIGVLTFQVATTPETSADARITLLIIFGLIAVVAIVSVHMSKRRDKRDAEVRRQKDHEQAERQMADQHLRARKERSRGQGTRQSLPQLPPFAE